MAMVPVGHNRIPDFPINSCLSDENEIFSYGAQQVPKYVSGISRYLYVCGNVNRRHDVVETIHTCALTILWKTLYLDVAKNSRTRILVTVVTLCALEISEIDPIYYLYFVLYELHLK